MPIAWDRALLVLSHRYEALSEQYCITLENNASSQAYRSFSGFGGIELDMLEIYVIILFLQIFFDKIFLLNIFSLCTYSFHFSSSPYSELFSGRAVARKSWFTIYVPLGKREGFFLFTYAFTPLRSIIGWNFSSMTSGIFSSWRETETLWKRWKDEASSCKTVLNKSESSSTIMARTYNKDGFWYTQKSSNRSWLTWRLFVGWYKQKEYRNKKLTILI